MTKIEPSSLPTLASGASPKIYKVSEITREIKLILEGRFPAVWVEGEISNFKRHSSGHMYLTLKDETAQIAGVFFSRQNQFLKFEPKDGLKVIAIGRISVYDARGNYQLYVERMEPKGLGALQLAFLQLKEKLEKEGLFDPARKKLIPRYPRKIGIVTSPTGAALQDMLKVFRRVSAGLHIQILPVRVQGEGSAEEIAQAIDEFNRRKEVEVLVAGRGGGSLEDLWAFNEEVVARAVARSEIPVISAVGHEIDWTICDLAADHRAHTPTAAAEHLVFHWNELEAKVADAKRRMQSAVMNLLKSKKDLLAQLVSSYGLRQPFERLKQLWQSHDELLRQLRDYAASLVERKKGAFETLAGKLHALSPLAVLERGYSMTMDAEGKILRSASGLRAGESIKTRLASGEIESVIKHLSKEGEKRGT